MKVQNRDVWTDLQRSSRYLRVIPFIYSIVRRTWQYNDYVEKPQGWVRTLPHRVICRYFGAICGATAHGLPSDQKCSIFYLHCDHARRNRICRRRVEEIAIKTHERLQTKMSITTRKDYVAYSRSLLSERSLQLQGLSLYRIGRLASFIARARLCRFDMPLNDNFIRSYEA